MILALHPDASYNSQPESKSRASGQYYLYKLNDENSNNGTVLFLSKIITHVMTSDSEVKLATLFYNYKAGIPLRISLKEMGHHQSKTPVTTDKTTAQGLINKTMI